MDSDQFRRVRQMLLQALECTPGERSAYLDQIGAEDPKLLGEVCSLLEHEASVRSLLSPEGVHLGEWPVRRLNRLDHLGELGISSGASFRHYRIEEQLGHGGMGQVFRAVDTRLGRSVAIKFLSPLVHGDTQAENRFLQEARCASALDHPHICVIHEIDRAANGALYIVMAYYGGGSLRDRLDRGPLPVPEAMRVLSEIARGLEAAHRQGIIHRDIKPANIMLTSEHSARIIDFGLAKLVGDALQTRSGVGLGTVAYMSPEQVKGEDVDARSDLFSLGCVLYEMVVGTPPFRGTLGEVLWAILHEDPPRLSLDSKTVPTSLQPVLDRLVAKAPDGRFGSAAELIEVVEEIGASAAVHGSMSPETASPPKTRRRVRPLRALRYAWLLTLPAVVWMVFWAVLSLGLFTPHESPLHLEPRHIAIGSFENRSADTALDFLSVQLAEEISQGLTELEGIAVSLLPLQEATPGGALSSAGREAMLQSAVALGVDAVVWGSYHVAGDTMVLNARVEEPATGERILSLPLFRAAVPQSSDLCQEFRDRLLGGVAVTYGSIFNEPIARAPRLAAARAYVAAQKTFFRRPRQLLTTAWERDSTFTLPLLLLARDALVENDERADSLLSLLEHRRPWLSAYEQHRLDLHRAEGARRYEEALRHARLAERLAPRDFLIKYTISDLLWKLGRAAEVVGLGQELSMTTLQQGHPGHARMLLRELDALHFLGRHEEQLTRAQEARMIFPDDNQILGRHIQALAALHRIEDVMSAAERAFARPEESGDPALTLLPAMLTLRASGQREASIRLANRVYDWLGGLTSHQARKYSNLADRWLTLYLAERWQDAAAALEQVKARHADNRSRHAYLGWDGLAAARLGDRQKALEVIALLHERAKQTWREYRDYKECAEIAAVLGEKEMAVRFLRQAFAAGLEHDLYLHENPDLEGLRGYPPYDQLIRINAQSFDEGSPPVTSEHL